MWNFAQDYTGVKLHVAIGVFISSTIDPHSEYVEDTTRAFRSPVQKIDFEKSAQATDIINRWCMNRTHGLVNNIVNSSKTTFFPFLLFRWEKKKKSSKKRFTRTVGDINANTSIVLANAVYFKGTWLKKFDVVDTRDRTFYLNEVTEKQVPTMSLVDSFRHGEYPEVNATFLQLPYKVNSEKIVEFCSPSQKFHLENKLSGVWRVSAKEKKTKLRIARDYTVVRYSRGAITAATWACSSCFRTRKTLSRFLNKTSWTSRSTNSSVAGKKRESMSSCRNSESKVKLTSNPP